MVVAKMKIPHDYGAEGVCGDQPGVVSGDAEPHI